nr:hypothetical protein [Escherichia coli]
MIHYKAADGRATTEWFGEPMLEATEDDRYWLSGICLHEITGRRSCY